MPNLPIILDRYITKFRRGSVLPARVKSSKVAQILFIQRFNVICKLYVFRLLLFSSLALIDNKRIIDSRFSEVVIDFLVSYTRLI